RGIHVDQFGQRLSFFLDCGLDVEYIALARVSRFFFSSRRRHTRSVSAFLLNRSSDLKSLDTLKVKIISVTFRRVIRTNHKKASKIWRHENIQLGGCQS